MFLVAIILSLMIPVVDYFNLHLMQNCGYKNKKYVSTLYNRFFNRATISILSAILLMVILGLIQYLLVVYDIELTYINYFVLIYLFFILVDHIILSENSKINLNYTKRLIRLIIIWMLINVIIAMLICYIVLELKFSITYPFITIIILFKPFTLVFANLCILPIEKFIANRYIKKAKQKLDGKNIIKIGITGSYGKTTVKFILRDILSTKYTVLATPYSYNTPMGICLTINDLDNQKIFIAEMGARQKGDIKELAYIVNPDIGIVTGVAPQHIETFKNIQTIFDTKYELVEVARKTIFNGYNEYTKKMFEISTKEKYITGDDVYAENIKYEQELLKFDLVINSKSYQAKTRLIGKHNIENILLCVKCAQLLGLSAEEIIQGITNIKPIPNRLECVKNGNKIIIDDSYNSNVIGSKQAITTAKEMGKRVLVVTPGMVELGDIQYNENYLFAKYIAKHCSELIIVNKVNRNALYNGAVDGKMDKDSIHIVDTLDKAKEILKNINCDVVLFENDLTDDYI